MFLKALFLTGVDLLTVTAADHSVLQSPVVLVRDHCEPDVNTEVRHTYLHYRVAPEPSR